MKFTSYDLMKAMGLQVGDKVKFVNNIEFDNEIFEIIEKNNSLMMVLLSDETISFSIHYLVDYDFEILPKPKRVGDLKCGDFKDCNKCPLVLCCDLIDGFSNKDTFDEILETLIIRDQEIYDLLKARLDKVVSE